VTIKLNKLAAALMCYFLAAGSAMAQLQPDSRLKEKLALVEPRGFVMVNGANIKDLQALFPGDKVRTGENARAILELRLATATLTANSCATYRPNFIEITCGTTLIRTKSRTTALLCKLSIIPSSDDAEYIASLSRDYVVVISKRGEQMLDSGKERIPLAAETTFTRPRSEVCRIE
jgi:hypothetical protein